jgi:hypothetical protein
MGPRLRGEDGGESGAQALESLPAQKKFA